MDNNWGEQFDKLDMRLDSIDKTLCRQEISLSEHQRRTELLEKQNEKCFEELKPIQRHISMMDGAIRFLGLSSVGLSLIAGLLKLFGVL